MSVTPDQTAPFDAAIAAGKQALGRTKVAVVGLGSVAHAATQYLAAAGVGVMYLFDDAKVCPDAVSRQVLFRLGGIGAPKAEAAVAALRGFNPDAKLHAINRRIDLGNAGDILADFDMVVDGTNDRVFALGLNDACVINRRPLATASVAGMSGYSLLIVPGRSACLRCFAEQTEPLPVGDGVLGAAAGILGAALALECIRFAVGLWRPQPDSAAIAHILDGPETRLATRRVAQCAGCRCAARIAATTV